MLGLPAAVEADAIDDVRECTTLPTLLEGVMLGPDSSSDLGARLGDGPGRLRDKKELGEGVLQKRGINTDISSTFFGALPFDVCCMVI